MNLAELLEHTGKEYLDDRTELLDGDADDLFPDSLIVRYLNEAQRILCRRSHVLIEYGVAPAGVVTLIEGKTTYSLHRAVRRVYYAVVEGEELMLPRYPEEAFIAPPSTYLEDFDIDRSNLATPGDPIAIATDAGSRTLRVYPPPAAAQTGTRLLLKVARLPLCMLSTDKLDECPEVDEDWHMALCGYAAGRCLTQPNVSSAGKADGKLLLAEFAQTVKEARQERIRAERAPVRFGYASTTARL